MVIFKGENVQTTWFPGTPEIPDWPYVASTKGWTSDDICLKWVESGFLPDTVPSNPTAWRLLICDGHGSHTQPELFQMALQHKVYVLFFPAHGTHLLQPLDLVPFANLKKRYREQLRELARHLCGSSVQKRQFLILYKQAKIKALTPRAIRGGFRAAGIFPRDQSLPLFSHLLVPHLSLDNQPETSENPLLLRQPPPQLTPNARRTAIEATKDCNREVRTFIRNLVKELEDCHAIIMRKDEELASLRAQVASSTRERRRRVRSNPNQEFITAFDVAVARGEIEGDHSSNTTSNAAEQQNNDSNDS